MAQQHPLKISFGNTHLSNSPTHNGLLYLRQLSQKFDYEIKLKLPEL